jgi:hypothetical protein
VLAMSAQKKTLEERIAAVVRLFSSNKDGDKLAAVYSLERVLMGAGTDFNGLACGIENLGKAAETTAADRKKIWDAAVQHTENRLHGADDFASTDGKPTWQSVALYCQRQKQRLAPKHHDFIDKVASQTVYNREPTQPMHKYLFSLFLQLGGKIT